MPVNRRFILTATVAAVTPTSFAFAAPETKTMPEATPTYDSNGIALNSFSEKWPEKKHYSRLIIEIATLIAPWPWESLGYFYINCDRINDYIVERGADLSQEFGIFMSFASGAQYAVWYHEGAVPGSEPIVDIDDEGQFSLIAPTLHSFFTQWAQGNGIGRLEPFDYDATPEMLADRRKKGDEILALIASHELPDPPAPAPDFALFMENQAKAGFAANQNDPTMRKIATLMDKYIPRGATQRHRVSFDLKAQGEAITVKTNLIAPEHTEHAPLPEREALIPLLNKARDERASGATAILGKWKSAVLRLTPDGHVEIAASWDA